MSLPPFIDGFPNQAQAAVNFSYFLTPEEKAEWTSWLTSANDEQQDELITILHQMWEQSKASTVPNGFGGQTNVQPVAPAQQQQQVPTSQPQQDPTQLIQQMPPAMAAMGQFGQMGQSPVQTQQPAPQPLQQAPVQPEQPQQQYTNPFVNEDSKAKEIEKADMMASEPTYAPNPIISNPESVEGVDFKADVNKIPQPQVEEEDDFEFETEEEATSYKPTLVETKKQVRSEEQAPELETESGSEEDEEAETTKPERRTTTSGIDFSVIRESSNKTALASLKEEYINARETQEAVYGDFVTKTTEILSNFEDINDYIEAMTDKVLSINDEVVSQAQEIQDLKNGTQTRGAALQDQVDELRYDIEKISKELRNVRIEIKRSNDEIRQRLSLLEADSFRQANDGIEARFALIKSEMSKMQEVLTNQSSNSLNQVANNFSLPQQNPRISRLSSVNFKK